jgi:hypothetical protein
VLELKLVFYLLMCVFRTSDLFMRMCHSVSMCRLFGARVALLDLFHTKDFYKFLAIPMLIHRYGII